MCTDNRWLLKIVKADNGYILEYNETTSDGKEKLVQQVRQESELDNLQAIELVLWDVLDFFGCLGSKHDEERLRITRIKKNETL